MKFTEIQVGEFYEVGEGGFLRYAKVLETGEFTTRVYSGRSVSGYPSKQRGALVQYCDQNGKLHDSKPEWIRSQAVKQPMMAAVKRDAAKQEALAEEPGQGQAPQ